MIPNRIKQLAVSVLGFCARRAIFDRMTASFFSGRVNVFLYHGVWPAGSKALRLFTGMTLDRFVRDLRILRGHFDLVPLDDLLAGSIENDTRKPRGALTFDDGFDLIQSGAADVLDELQIPATMFVNTASVRYERMMWQHQFHAIKAVRGTHVFLRSLNHVFARTGISTIDDPTLQIRATRRWPSERKDEYAREVWELSDMPAVRDVLHELKPYLGWSGLRQWMNRGHTVGCHTHSHPFCSSLDSAGIESEIVAPLADIETELGVGQIPFAYPFGDRLQTSDEEGLARRHLYTCLLGTSLDLEKRDRAYTNRVDMEPSIDGSLFGWPIAKALKAAVSEVRFR